MLKYLTTPLFDSPAQTLVNTVNTVGVMGKGIAAEFKRRYPEMFDRYRVFCQSKQLDIGKLYLYRTPNKWVLNFPTKKHWRYPSKMVYIEAGLQKFVSTYTECGVSSIAFPQLGCGNGGLNWDDVRPVMHRYLNGLAIPVYIHVTSRRAGFVPEHLDINELAQMRQDISFQRFWNDLHSAAHLQQAVMIRSDDGDMSPLNLIIDGRTISLAGEDLADLWNSLRLKGALAPDDFPGALRDVSDTVLKLLLKLDYLKSQRFLKPDIRGHRGFQDGVRFSPLPAIEDAIAINVEAQA